MFSSRTSRGVRRHFLHGSVLPSLLTSRGTPDGPANFEGERRRATDGKGEMTKQRPFLHDLRGDFV